MVSIVSHEDQVVKNNIIVKIMSVPTYQFFIGCVMVVGLSLSGCSKQPESNATDSARTVDAEKRR